LLVCEGDELGEHLTCVRVGEEEGDCLTRLRSSLAGECSIILPITPGDLQSNPIVILSSEGDCHGNQSHSKIDTTTSSFQKNDALCPGNPALFPKTNIFISNLLTNLSKQNKDMFVNHLL
jgi:hypothetical protein